MADTEMQQALLKAKRRIRDLTRDDPVTGLLNARTFREVLAHDWAVAAREKASLALVAFTLDDFDAYVEVFGRHAASAGLRRQYGGVFGGPVTWRPESRRMMRTAWSCSRIRPTRMASMSLPGEFLLPFANSACITRGRARNAL